MWNKKQECIYVDNQPVLLTEKEHRLLKLFITHKGNILSHEDIMIGVWEDAFDKDISLDSVKKQISHLRKKLPHVGIEVVYGKGYKLK